MQGGQNGERPADERDETEQAHAERAANDMIADLERRLAEHQQQIQQAFAAAVGAFGAVARTAPQAEPQQQQQQPPSQ